MKVEESKLPATSEAVADPDFDQPRMETMTSPESDLRKRWAAAGPDSESQREKRVPAQGSKEAVGIDEKRIPNLMAGECRIIPTKARMKLGECPTIAKIESEEKVVVAGRMKIGETAMVYGCPMKADETEMVGAWPMEAGKTKRDAKWTKAGERGGRTNERVTPDENGVNELCGIWKLAFLRRARRELTPKMMTFLLQRVQVHETWHPLGGGPVCELFALLLTCKPRVRNPTMSRRKKASLKLLGNEEVTTDPDREDRSSATLWASPPGCKRRNRRPPPPPLDALDATDVVPMYVNRNWSPWFSYMKTTRTRH